MKMIGVGLKIGRDAAFMLLSPPGLIYISTNFSVFCFVLLMQTIIFLYIAYSYTFSRHVFFCSVLIC